MNITLTALYCVRTYFPISGYEGHECCFVDVLCRKKKKKPLFLRMIEEAERQKQKEENDRVSTSQSTILLDSLGIITFII